jgi:hypothetical protein
MGRESIIRCSDAARYREAEERHKDEGKAAVGVAERRQWRSAQHLAYQRAPFARGGFVA